MKPFVLGLTGSIGMGKTTTAAMFADQGIPVWDADATVRLLYAPGGAAAKVVADLFPAAIEAGRVSRPKLRKMMANDPALLDQLQAVVHPMVAESRAAFLKNQTAPIVLLDIPLLFETGVDALCDATVVVTAPADVQRARVLARGEMTTAEFEMILARQMPDAEKQARADYIIETLTPDGVRAAVNAICADINRKLPHA